jgi:4-amino-4-deoxy-L-arabinose transferase
MQHPLLPTLYDEKLFDLCPNDRWDRCYIWLHKQPLFLWQIALSYKIFGINEFALRLPGILLSCMLVYAGYRSGKILRNENTGYYTGVLLLSSDYWMRLVSGRIELDQNDVAFIAYISFSFWAWFEYLHSQKTYWLLLAGLFAGCAVMCKWLVGLLFYLPFGLHSLIENKFHFRKYSGLFLSVAMTLLIALPWQILSFSWYPFEAKVAFELNARHFTEAIDGHRGSYFYHFELLPTLFGTFTPVLLLPSALLFYRRAKWKNIVLLLLVTIIFVYLFFSVAVTKMPSFTNILVLPMYLSLAFLLDYSEEKLSLFNTPTHRKAILMSLAALLVLVWRMDVLTIVGGQGLLGAEKDSSYIASLQHNKLLFKNLHLPARTVLFNVPGRHSVEAMFYSGVSAYPIVPSQEQCDELLQQQYNIAIFEHGNNPIPNFVRNNPKVLMIKDTVHFCE